MQRYLPLLVLLGSFALPSCSCKDDPADLAEEDVAEEEAYDHDHGQWLALGLSADGSPLAAYYDRTKGAIRLAQGALSSDGSVQWDGVEVDGYAGDDGLDPGDIGVYASMAVASDGTIWLSYYNQSVGGLYYASCSPELSCETGLADSGSGASPDAGQWSSIALDSSDNPVIAHYDAYNQTLRVAHWNGSGFTAEVVDEGEDYVAVDTGDEDRDAQVGQYARILIQGGQEYIAYYDAAHGDLKLASGSSGSYSIMTVDSQGDVGAWPSMLTVDGVLYIAYHDVGNQDLKVATTEGGSWNHYRLDDGQLVGADSEIYQEADGRLSVIYSDGQNNNIKRVSQTGSGWGPPENIAGQDSALGFHNEILRFDGGTYIGSYDYTHRTLWFSAL